MNTISPHAHEGNPRVVVIPLTKGYTAIVDEEDADLIQLRWQYSHGYASHGTHANNNGRRTTTSISMHRLILKRKLGRAISQGMQVDHINRDKLDNRRENLREVTIRQNQYNRTTQTRHPHGYKGLCLNKIQNKWMVHIRVEGKALYLGYYANPEDAARAYDRAAITYHGEFASLNFPREDYENP